jgi:C-terminal processing protease CtpA/Prc
VEAAYWYEYWPEARTLYLQYNECRDLPGTPFASVVQSMFAVADSAPVERLIVDLRGNGGGDSRVVMPLLEGLSVHPGLSDRRHLYGLVGRGTCSSGMMAALDLERRFGALLVGEPTGGKPNAYGDIGRFELPHSKLVVQYSTKRFTRGNGNKPSLMPHLPASLSLDDCLAGRDPVLEGALSFPLE